MCCMWCVLHVLCALRVLCKLHVYCTLRSILLLFAMYVLHVMHVSPACARVRHALYVTVRYVLAYCLLILFVCCMYSWYFVHGLYYDYVCGKYCSLCVYNALRMNQYIAL